MKTDRIAAVRIPIRQRWQTARLRLLPGAVFAAGAVAVALLWRDHVAPLTIIGQAEPVISNVSCYKPGVVEELNVSRFQKVKEGDPVGKIRVTEPRILAASLAVIQADIESLQVNFKPVLPLERAAMSYDQLRLDWMKQRTQLAIAKVNLDLAQAEYQRMDALYKDQIVSQRVFEQAKAARDRLKDEVEQLTKLVSEGEGAIQRLQPTNGTEISAVSTNPLVAAIAVQESKLRLTEAELSPLVVKAPISGIVTTIFHRPGEGVTAGEPIIATATLNPVRIVGYLRTPIMAEPKVGMHVDVRTRGLHREKSPATITEVGTQLEIIPPTLLGPVTFASIIQGLPIEVSLPPGLKIRAGELVDIILPSQNN
ncbi:MAG: HlyD family efflux transporter periplasmic adaptor subunit [Verrucomicrobiota bacterium]|jgi:multidrug resistance efflux pump